MSQLQHGETHFWLCGRLRGEAASLGQPLAFILGRPEETRGPRLPVTSWALAQGTLPFFERVARSRMGRGDHKILSTVGVCTPHRGTARQTRPENQKHSPCVPSRRASGVQQENLQAELARQWKTGVNQLLQTLDEC